MGIKVSVYIATSLDGFIAREDGDLNWLDEANASAPEGEDFGYLTFMDTVDVLIMGRNTYEKVLSFGQWPYDKPVIVLSHNPISFPSTIPDSVIHSSESLSDLLKLLSDQGAEHVYVDGGMTIQGFLSKGLVDEITITEIPVILGKGIPLFGPLKKDIKLTHKNTTAFDIGFVQSTYLVNKHN